MCPPKYPHPKVITPTPPHTHLDSFELLLTISNSTPTFVINFECLNEEENCNRLNYFNQRLTKINSHFVLKSRVRRPEDVFASFFDVQEKLVFESDVGLLAALKRFKPQP